MQSINVFDNKTKINLILEYNKDGVHSVKMEYSEPIPLSNFINYPAFTSGQSSHISRQVAIHGSTPIT